MVKPVSSISNEVLNCLQDLLFVFDEHHKLLLWNHRLSDLTGYTDSELSKIQVSDLFVHEQRPLFENTEKAVWERGSSSCDLLIVSKSKDRIPYHFICTPFKNRDNASRGICFVGRDGDSINEVRRVGSIYRPLFNGMMSGFCHCEIISDRNNHPIDIRFIDVNPAFERIMGIERNRIINNTAGEILPGFEKFLISTYKSLNSQDQHLRSVYALGEREAYLEATSFSPDTDQLITLFTDITESRKVKEENRLLQSQLFQAQKMEDVGRLTGGIAHDFNNLLTAIHGYTDLALMQKNNEQKLKENLEQISLATQRAARLAQQLLFFSKRESEQHQPCNLNDVIANLDRMLRRIIGEHISVRLDLEPDIWVCSVNQNQIEQIIMNLAINARDAMPKGGSLTIATKNVSIDNKNLTFYPFGRSGKFVCLSVEDSGAGMSRETIDQIFKPFFTTKGSGKGTGLGLSVVNGIVKEHNGWINVYSEENKGTTFKTYLPAQIGGDSAEEEHPGIREQYRGRGEKILFVEDDDSIREYMNVQLLENGYTVIAARNVQEAIEISARENYGIHLLFTDAVLPDKNGTELIDALFNHNPDLKVILTSGYAYGNTDVPALNGKSFRFINKPYTLNDSMKAIRDILDL
jgi:PAS domain S-box-containing protein